MENFKEGDKATHTNNDSNLATEIEEVKDGKVKFIGNDEWYEGSEVVLVESAGPGFLN